MPSLKKVKNRFGKPKPNTWEKRDPFIDSPEWRNFRAKYFPTYCRGCKKINEHRMRKATHLDHIKPRRFWPELKLDPSNVQPLCLSCHNIKSAHEKQCNSKADWLVKAKEQGWI